MTDALDLAFLSGFVLRISFTVEIEGPIVTVDEKQWGTVMKYNLLDVSVSVERLVSGAGVLTLIMYASGDTIIGGGPIESTGVPTRVSSRNARHCRCRGALTWLSVRVGGLLRLKEIMYGRSAAL
jgi:hypothetical protein